MKARRELLLFGAADVLYNAGRGITNGDMTVAVAAAVRNPRIARSAELAVAT